MLKTCRRRWPIPPTWLTVLSGFLLCLGSATAWSEVPGPSSDGAANGGDWQVNGFGTAGLTRLDVPPGWEYQRSINSAPDPGGLRADTDSRLGLQVNYQAGDRIEFVGQVVLSRHAPAVPANSTLTWAFMAWRPDADWTVRVGRVNFDQYLMSEYKNVGFAYLYARPPVEFYAVQPDSADGIDLTRAWNAADAQYRAKAIVGRANSGGYEFSPDFGLELIRESDDGLNLRAGWSRNRTSRETPALEPLLQGLATVARLPVPPVAVQAQTLYDHLNFVGEAVNYLTLDAAYDAHAWVLAAEYTHLSGGPAMHYQAGYASVGHRFGELTLFGISSIARGHDPQFASPAWDAALAPALGSALAQQVQALGDAATYAINLSPTQITQSIGLRWDFRPRVALKLQYDHGRISAGGASFWFASPGNAATSNMTSLVLDFVF